MLSRFRRELDPLDLEIIEMAFDGAWDAIEQKSASLELDSDKQLEAALRRELIEIAFSIGLSDPEALRDALVTDLADIVQQHLRDAGSTAQSASGLRGTLPSSIVRAVHIWGMSAKNGSTGRTS